MFSTEKIALIGKNLRTDIELRSKYSKNIMFIGELAEAVGYNLKLCKYFLRLSLFFQNT